MQQASRATRKPTGAQRAGIVAILDGEEDQFDKLDLAVEKASADGLEKLERPSAPVPPRSMPVNFAGATFQNCSSHFLRHEMKKFNGNFFVCGACASGPAHTVGSVGSGPDQLFRFFFLSTLEANGFSRSWKLNEIEHHR